jgi:predicted nucleic acid-binding protein
VIVYSRDQNAPQKRDRAIAWLTALATGNSIVISPQVLNESISAFIRKLGFDSPELSPFAHAVAPWCTAPFGVAVTEQALKIRDRWQFEWWDSLIIASAIMAGCDFILTEDLQDGQKLGGLEVVDPFVREPSIFNLTR